MNTADKIDYNIIEGEYIIKSTATIKWAIIKHVFILFLHFLIYSVAYLGSVLITFYIFLNCISEIPEDIFSNLEPSISLGAIFATLGSAIVAIYSLYCNEQLRKFHETLTTLQSSLLETASWTRWQFLKRYHVVKHLHKYYCYCLINPSITFQNDKESLKLFLPYAKEDFYELPIFLSYCRILRFRKKYLHNVCNFQQISFQSELILLDCLTCLYRNIINYKKGRFFLVIGCFFIFNSILFSMFYYAIWREFILPH